METLESEKHLVESMALKKRIQHTGQGTERKDGTKIYTINWKPSSNIVEARIVSLTPHFSVSFLFPRDPPLSLRLDVTLGGLKICHHKNVRVGESGSYPVNSEWIDMSGMKEDGSTSVGILSSAEIEGWYLDIEYLPRGKLKTIDREGGFANMLCWGSLAFILAVGLSGAISK